MANSLRPVWDRSDARQAVYTADEAARWPSGVLDRLTALGLLKAIANAASVVCDACGGDHVEEVLFVESPSGSGMRAYIRCREAGRVPVPLDRLRQWQVDFRRLAEVTASALSASGGVEEVVPSRIWLLGKATLAGQPREVFLAGGLAWSDGPAVVGGAGRLLASRQPVVLVPGSTPPPDVWRGAIPAVLPLSALLSWDETQFVIDQPYLESALAQGRKSRPIVAAASFPTPAGAVWEDVRFTVAEHRLAIDVKGRKQEFTFQEAGFEEKRRKGVPDRLWRLLSVFAIRGGVVPFDSLDLDRAFRNNLKQNVSHLGKRLNNLLHLEGKPFQDARKGRRYETRFVVSAVEGVKFPTPEGTAWDAVSITEIRPGTVAVSVDAAEAFAVYTPHDNDRRTGGRWESAEQAGALERRYDLRTLGLAGDDRAPNAAGAALLEVLRSGGKVRRKEDDAAMLALCGSLSRLMQIDKPPFQFSRGGQTWSALFDASSTLGGDSR